MLPTAVQQEAIPLILTGGDVLAAAETGSGKTGAFGLPCLQIVHETLRGKCQMRDPSGSALRCELSRSDRDLQIEVAANGVECNNPKSDRWYGVRATVEVLKGKYMFEVEVVKGLTRVGWSSSASRLELGTEHKSFGFGSTGKKSWNRQFEDYGEPFDDGDVIGCLIDREAKAISFCKNGRDLGLAYTIPDDLDDVGLAPHVCGKGFAVVCKFDGKLEYPVDAHPPVGDIRPDDAGTIQTGDKKLPMCMILEPSRELADQTYQCMTKFAKYLEGPSIRVGLFVGGVEEREQLGVLDRGVDIVVGTLQKTADLVRRNKMDVSQVRFLVLDEADDLQKKDDKGDIAHLNSVIKSSRKDRVQTLLFSATLHSEDIHKLIEEITTNATWVDLKGKDAVPETVHHVIYPIDPTLEMDWLRNDEEVAVHAKCPGQQPTNDGVHKNPSMSPFDQERPEALRLSERLKQMKPKLLLKIADSFKMTQCLIFCRTNVDCNHLESYFNRLGGAKSFGGKVESGKENPYSCVVLAGARTQKDRQKALEAFKDGDVRFLICTDVAARGIDIAGLPFVIQMSLPDDIENYIHRIGRCGRAERLGLCVSLPSTVREKVWYHKCASKGKNCVPAPGNTKLCVPFGSDGKPLPEDKDKWLVEEGGCTTWFDEPDLLQKITARVGQPMKVMDADDFSCEGVVDSPLEESKRKKRKRPEEDPNWEAPSRRKLKTLGPQAVKAAVTYGSKRNDANATALAGQASAIAPTVLELSRLEKNIQQMFTRAWMLGVGSEQGDATKNILAPKGPVCGQGGLSSAKKSPPAPAAAVKEKKKVRW